MTLGNTKINELTIKKYSQTGYEYIITTFMFTKKL